MLAARQGTHVPKSLRSWWRLPDEVPVRSNAWDRRLADQESAGRVLAEGERIRFHALDLIIDLEIRSAPGLP